jgi:hypothetical protein
MFSVCRSAKWLALAEISSRAANVENLLFCDHHFLPNQFIDPFNLSTSRLLPMAIPTLFECCSSNKVLKCNSNVETTSPISNPLPTSPLLYSVDTPSSIGPNFKNCLPNSSLQLSHHASLSLSSSSSSSSSLSSSYFNTLNFQKFQTAESFLTTSSNQAKKRKLDVLPLQKEPRQIFKKFCHSVTAQCKSTQTRKSKFSNEFKNVVIKQLRKQVFYYKKKLAAQTDKIKKLKSLKSPITFENWQKLSKYQTDFIEMQVAGVNAKQAKSLRYTDSQKRLSLTMYYQNYEHLRSIFTMPNSKTLSNYVETSKIKLGINDLYLHLLSQKLLEFKYDKMCMLTFDGMSIAQALQYNIKSDSIIGFSDFGDARRTNTMANQIIVFMLRGLRRNWKQPIAFYLNKGNLSDCFLKKTILEIIKSCFEHGIIVKAITCDQETQHQKLYKKLVGDESYFIHEQTKEKVFCFFDSCHLIKSTRNCLFSHDVELQSGKIASWNILRLYFNFYRTKDIKVCTKLTESHINLPFGAKMRVRLATQVLSRKLAIDLQNLCDLNYFKLENCEGTIQYLEKTSMIFNLFNSLNNKQPLLCGGAITKDNFNEFVYKCEEFKQWIMNLKVYDNADNVMPTMPFQKGWCLTIDATCGLVRELLDDSWNFFATSRLQQDALENLFSQLRRDRGGFCSHPNANKAMATLGAIAMNMVTVPVSQTSNCKKVFDFSLLDPSNKICGFEVQKRNIVIPTVKASIASRRRAKFTAVSTIWTAAQAMPYLHPVEKDIVGHILGAGIRAFLKIKKCELCRTFVTSNSITSNITFKLDNSINKDELFHPKLIITQEFHKLEQILRKELQKNPCQKDIGQCIKTIFYKSSNLELAFPNCHQSQSYVFLVNYYIRTRLHFYCKQKTLTNKSLLQARRRKFKHLNVPTYH